jgi:hypothetical protein
MLFVLITLSLLQALFVSFTLLALRPIIHSSFLEESQAVSYVTWQMQVTTKVFELVKAFGEAVVDAKLAKELGDRARRRAIVGGNMAHLLDDEQLVGVPDS